MCSPSHKKHLSSSCTVLILRQPCWFNSCNAVIFLDASRLTSFNFFKEGFASCFSSEVDILLSSGVGPEYLIEVEQTTIAQVLLVQLKSNNLPGDECGRVRRLPAGKVADRAI